MHIYTDSSLEGRLRHDIAQLTDHGGSLQK